jgi:hypothetical protein
MNTEVDVLDFPFVADLPKREVKRIHSAFDELQRISELVQEMGLPVSISTSAKLLGVSSQRISELLKDGLLERMDWGGRTYVTQRSIVKRLESARQVGRPRKLDQK